MLAPTTDGHESDLLPDASMATSLSAFRTIGRKIVCVGRNFRDHALELNNPIPKKPLLFMKASSAFVTSEGVIPIPQGCNNLHQEVELAVVIGKTATKVGRANAMSFVGGYAVALDMTARDWQDEAKKAGNPWFLAKSFDGSCPVSDFIPVEKIPDPHNVEVYCKINGKDQQRCSTSHMIFDIPTLLEFCTQWVTLERGDLVLTGTPAGVTKVNSGDVIEFGLAGISATTMRVQ